MNRYQKFYVGTTLEAIQQQYEEVNEKLEAIYKEFSKDKQKLAQQLSMILYQYEIIEEKIVLTAKQQKKIKDKMQMTIFDMVTEQVTNEKAFVKNVLGDAVKDTYNYQEYLLSLGIDFKLLPLSEKEIEKIVNSSIKGEKWSKRIWHNEKVLEGNLQDSIYKFIKGEISVNDISKKIDQNFKAKKYQITRITRTELCRVQQDILNEFDEKHGVTYQLFMATLDDKTSEICRDLDGKQYAIDDPDKPNPPEDTHPNCRSCLVGIPSEDYKPETRRNNQNNEIINYKPYKEWSSDD